MHEIFKMYDSNPAYSLAARNSALGNLPKKLIERRNRRAALHQSIDVTAERLKQHHDLPQIRIKKKKVGAPFQDMR